MITYTELLAILVNSHRMPGEDSESLVNRVINDSVIFSSLTNSEPHFNESLLKGILTSPQFLNTL